MFKGRRRGRGTVYEGTMGGTAYEAEPPSALPCVFTC